MNVASLLSQKDIGLWAGRWRVAYDVFWSSLDTLKQPPKKKHCTNSWYTAHATLNDED